MGWGSFWKKAQAFGRRAIDIARQGVDFAKEKILPTAKKVMDVIGPALPYGGAIQKGLDIASGLVDEADRYTNIAQDVSQGKTNTLKGLISSRVRSK